MAVKKTAAQITEKWARKTKGATQDYKDGVNRVTESPTEKAAAASGKWLTKLNESQNRYETGLRKVSLEDWKKKAIEKGANRIAAGVDGAMSKRANFDQWLVGAVETAQGAIAGKPKLTLQDNIDRMVTYVSTMANNKYKGK